MTVHSIIKAFEPERWYPIDALAIFLDKQPRALRAVGGKVSFLEEIGYTMLEQHGMALVTRTTPRPAGFIITRDPQTVSDVARTLVAHATHEHDRAVRLFTIAKNMRQRAGGQLVLIDATEGRNEPTR